MEYYLSIKKNEVLIYGTCINLKDMLYKRKESWKTTDGAEINKELNGILPLSGWEVGGEIWSYSPN